VLVRRRPWLALVVLVLLAISATLFVNGGRRGSRLDDTIAFALELEDPPCEAPLSIALPAIAVAVVVTEVPLAPIVVDQGAVLSIAPKTSPPRS
jgi:hypothetical protein